MVDWDKEITFYKYYVFTLGEIRDLIFSAIILGFLFSSILHYFQYTGFASLVKNFLISVVIVGPALILHELAHKFMAQRYGCKAHYVLWPMGAIFSIFLSFLTGVIFAALGAVMISTKYSTRLGYKYIELSREEIGKISISGPLTNLGLAIISFILSPLSKIFLVSAQVNLIVAMFNLIPFPPLDGSKVFAWSRLAWINALAVVLCLLILPSYVGLGLSILISIVVGVLIFLLARLISPWKHPEVVHRY
ncbi:MAG: hypothetical protein J7K22_04305 [Nanoarchaeota archaeon]|nr:hypothetical protein [Nanoarchaeota archaeon]